MGNVQDTVKEIENWLKRPGSYKTHKPSLSSAFHDMVLLTVHESLKDSNSRIPKDFKVNDFKRKVTNLNTKDDFERIAGWVEKETEPQVRASFFTRFLTNYVNSLANKFYMNGNIKKAKMTYLAIVPFYKFSQYEGL